MIFKKTSDLENEALFAEEMAARQGDLMADFDKIIAYCQTLFKNKNCDYGPSWLLYRFESLNDEIWRKAKRVRTLEEHDGKMLIPEASDVEYIGIINYAIMFLIKLDMAKTLPNNGDMTERLSELDSYENEQLFEAYSEHIKEIRTLLQKKNTDYGDAWKGMSLYAMTDQVIIRSYRIRRILMNKGETKVSEGIAAQLHDIINYCVFALIKLQTPIIEW